MRRPRVIVIGAGIGGLTSALTLAHQGCDVVVCEARDTVGGKIRQVTPGGGSQARQAQSGGGIDSGPTVFTMRWVFDDLFGEIGHAFEDHVTLTPLDLLARHYWPDGSALDLFANTDDSAAAIARFAGADEADRYRAFCDKAKTTFETLDATYMRAPRPSVAELVMRIARRRPIGLTAIHPFRTLWDELGRQFTDPRLRQLFGRYATYCGSSPFNAPATLMLIAHAEQCGVWMVDGGMLAVAQALADRATAAGADVRLNTPVAEIRAPQGRVSGVETADGTVIDADAVVFNGDINALARGLLGEGAAWPERAIPPEKRSQSAVTWSMLGVATGQPLAPHTVVFSDDYAREFDDVFGRGQPPTSPTVYLHAPDCHPRGAEYAPPLPIGAEPQLQRLFLLINAPADGDHTDGATREYESCRENAFQNLNRCGLTLQSLPTASVTTGPPDFARMFPATGGALYGRASHGWQASFRRPGSRTPIHGLYLAGGSVHPGPGVPMAALSGRLAAASLMTDFPLPRRSQPAATIGGMSTGSAMTERLASPSSHSSAAYFRPTTR